MILINKKNSLIGILILVFLLSTGYRMGTDWIEYERYYSVIEIDKFDLNFEKGYSIYSFIFKKKLGLNYTYFMILNLCFCNYILLKKVSIESKKKYLALYIFVISYLFFMSLEPILRQLIALSFVIFSLKYIERNKWWLFFCSIFFGAQFHQTVYIMLIIYPLNKVNLNLKKILLLFLGSYIILDSLEKILFYIAKIIPKFSKYNAYLNHIRYGQNTIDPRILFFKILIGLIFILLIYYYYKPSLEKRYIKNLGIFYCILFIFQFKLNIIARIQDYFFIFFVISLCSLEYKGKFKKYDMLLVVVIFVYFTLIFYRKISTELNFYRYGKYKNYFIEVYFKNESSEQKKINDYNYKMKIKELLNKENEKI